MLWVKLCYNYLLGVYTEDTVSDDKNMFITELHCFKDLIVGLVV